MKYFLDTEFLEGTQKKTFLGIPVGNTKPTIDLISIGIVAEDGREYYSISKDFNFREAWNRYDLVIEQVYGDMRNHFPEGRKKKVYWIRENVLHPIFLELLEKDDPMQSHGLWSERNTRIGFKEFKRLLKKHGKTNKQIASEVINFINPDLGFPISAYNNSDLREGKPLAKHFDDHNVSDFDGYFYARPELYTYYGAYDHVVFCWLFGKMMNLPKGFPMYSKDLKQILDEKNSSFKINQNILHDLKSHPDYPQQENEHNALADAKWNKKLYDFLKNF